MRGFSLLELLIALTIATMAFTTAALSIFSAPLFLTRMQQETIAFDHSATVLSRIEHTSDIQYSRVHSIATTTTDGNTVSTIVDSLEDDVAERTFAQSTWNDGRNGERISAISSLIVNPNSLDSGCDPFISGIWSLPRVAGMYDLTQSDILPASPRDTYSIADMAVSGWSLAVAIGKTRRAPSSAIFFFDIGISSKAPKILGPGFDNASTSSIGFSTLATGDGYIYAGNGFGSASLQTCADGMSCSQIHIFKSASSEAPTRIASFSLATNAPPFAIISGGSSAPVASLAYAHNILYAGLAKTIAGDEFNIVDVHDPAHPRWLSGIRIGRTINGITISSTHAYLSTDDNTRELVVVDISDPLHPKIERNWNAPGSTGFGYGVSSSVRNGMIIFGRSYVSNAPELITLSENDLHSYATADIGTTRDPQSVRTILTRDFLTFVLTTSKLFIYDISDKKSSSLKLYAPPINLPLGFQAMSLTCRGNTLYIGMRNATGDSEIEAITASEL